MKRSIGDVVGAVCGGCDKHVTLNPLPTHKATYLLHSAFFVSFELSLYSPSPSPLIGFLPSWCLPVLLPFLLISRSSLPATPFTSLLLPCFLYLPSGPHPPYLLPFLQACHQLCLPVSRPPSFFPSMPWMPLCILRASLSTVLPVSSPGCSCSASPQRDVW